VGKQRASRADFIRDANPTRCPDYTLADVMAIRALQTGTASADQQKMALDYIINILCDTYGNPWRVDTSAKDVAIGRMAAGQNIVHILNSATSSTSSTELAAKVAARRSFKQEDEK